MPGQQPALSTISLIGMPGSGKSTVGVLLAKQAGLRFVDTDLDIQLREGKTLQQILESAGYRQLRTIEQEVLLALDIQRAVIATGGSVVYSEHCMERLSAAGPVIYLEAQLDTLQQRVDAAPPRGIASDSGLSYAAIFAERCPLYQRYASFTVSTQHNDPEQIAAAILDHLQATA